MSVKNRIGVTGNMNVKQRLGVQPKPDEHTGIPAKGDARFRLIQKKRQKITDARDRLAEIAKDTDARLKLNKLKKNQPTLAKGQITSNGVQRNRINQVPNGVQRNRVNQVPNGVQRNRINQVPNGVQRNRGNQVPNKFKANFSQFPNPKPNNSQNNQFKPVNRLFNAPAVKKNIVTGSKTQLKGGSLTRTVNRGPQVTKKPNFVAKKPSNFNTERYHPLPNNPNVVTIRNDNAGFSGPSNQRFPQRQPQLKGKRFMNSGNSSTSMKRPMSMQRPTSSAFPPQMPARNDIQSLMKTLMGNAPFDPYRSSHPFAQDIKPARLKITTANNYMDYNNAPVDEDRYGMRPPPPPRMPTVKRSHYDDYDEYYSSPPKRPAFSGDMMSRLDQAQRMSSSGYKVMVSNLHPMVTVEDVEELFRNVGSIKYARLVREGVAEVIFLGEIDAYRSVDVYNNRQLDGQPMNVTVIKNSDLSSSLSSSFSSRYSPPQQSRRSSMPFPAPLATPRQNMGQKSVLRAAGGSLYNNHESMMSGLSNKRSQKLDVSPDLNAIHHALFSGRNPNSANNNNSNLQVYIKLPKQPMRGMHK